jgi:hypothetical protein
VSAAKAFAQEPPRERLDNLDAIVRDFKWRFQDRNKTDQVIFWCRNSPNFATAVRRAVEARDENGKHHNHQSKVDITARRKLGSKIIKRKDKILRMKHFDRLHDLIDEIKPYGIGPVTVYDTAVRVGAYLRLEPESVYMHAGVRQGFKALQQAMDGMPTDDGVHGWTDPSVARSARVHLRSFPSPLRSLPADDVEDILCTYREVFLGWTEGVVYG